MIIKIVVDTRRGNADGRYPLKLSFANLGKKVLVGLNIYVFEHELDKNNQVLYTSDKATKREYQKHNSYIIKELSRANDLLHTLRLQNKDNISPSRFKDMFVKNDSSNFETFNSYFIKFIKNKDGQTANIYQATLNKIEKKYGKDIYFDDITLTWLEKFDKEMRKDGLVTNGRSIHFRNIRAVFNDAINRDVIGQELYPFRKFKIKNEKTRKRALSVEQLRKLFNYDGEYHLNWSRDIAKLIFFLIGINVKDLYSLSECNNEYIEYKRAKTGALYSIKVEMEAKDLFEKFKGENGLLCFSEEMNYKSFGIRINKHLRTLGKTFGIEQLTTYYLRHTWATIAAELDIPKETISAALGHSDKSVTDIYINFNRKKIDAANRKIIDYVFEISQIN